MKAGAVSGRPAYACGGRHSDSTRGRRRGRSGAFLFCTSCSRDQSCNTSLALGRDGPVLRTRKRSTRWSPSRCKGAMRTRSRATALGVRRMSRRTACSHTLSSALPPALPICGGWRPASCSLEVGLVAVTVRLGRTPLVHLTVQPRGFAQDSAISSAVALECA
jgi:hypothetical protein